MAEFTESATFKAFLRATAPGASTADIAAANRALDSDASLSPAKKAQMKSSLRARSATPAAADASGKSTTQELIDTTKSYRTQLDQLTATLFKSTAALRDSDYGANNLSKRVAKLATDMYSFGFDIDDVTQKTKYLSENLSTRLTPGFDKSLMAMTRQSLMWDKLGIGIEKQVSMQNLLQGSLGKTRDESTKTGRTLLKFAADTGMSFSQAFDTFNKTVPKFLGILGSGEMTRQTMLFSTRARRMGVDVGQLTGMMDQFDTMDSAQHMGAKLNATMSALGGGFDAVKASMMDWPERMEYMAKTVQDVMPRLKGMSAQQQRLMMKQLSLGFGTSVRTVRAMASYKPGMALPAELKMAAGAQPAAMGARSETEAARLATTTRQFYAALSKVDFPAVVTVADKLGVNLARLSIEARKLEQNLLTVGLNVAAKIVGMLAERIGAAVTAQVKASIGPQLTNIFTGFDTFQGMMMKRVGQMQAELEKPL